MGTSRIEKVLLDEIAATFEAHKEETDSAKKVALYARIDSLSLEASKFSIANEYDKMISGLGATGTNAYTSNDETVYINNIPSNELKKWLMVEGERFQTLVLRLFHTELETVYEEFNRSQDSINDVRCIRRIVTQPPLQDTNYDWRRRTSKNPSMYNIHEYFNVLHPE